MNDEKRPKFGTAEYEAWAEKRAAKRAKELFNSPTADFEESGIISGSSDLFTKSDAEKFPDELEEYTIEERRKLIKEVKKQN